MGDYDKAKEFRLGNGNKIELEPIVVNDISLSLIFIYKIPINYIKGF